METKHIQLGDVQTPISLGRFAVRKHNIMSQWLSGKTIFDPTMGEGNLLIALVKEALGSGYAMEDLPISNLHGCEINEACFRRAMRKMRKEYGIPIVPENFTNEDVLFAKEQKKYDLLLGNPPWQNFNSIVSPYKEEIKRLFVDYRLTEKGASLLLGSSRIDIAALVIKKSIQDTLKIGGTAIFFAPLSLVLNDGAHRQFRSFESDDGPFSLESVYDFKGINAFSGVDTRYALFSFVKGEKTAYPVPFFQRVGSSWVKKYAKPFEDHLDPLVISSRRGTARPFSTKITIGKQSKPRQGVNTCGANTIFFFDTCRYDDRENCLLSNKEQKDVILPKKYLYPVATKDNFLKSGECYFKWVFLPYREDGKPLSFVDTKKDTLLFQYLTKHKKRLSERKGVLIRSWIKKGYWWALLGVGEYNFYRYKIIWESYGRRTFSPKVFDGKFQANQSLQCYMPFSHKGEMEEVLHKLQEDRVREYLLSYHMENTMNWAQPGRIQKILSYHDEAVHVAGR